MSITPGAQLGPYEVLSPLGAGGMGEVYRARDTRLGREVAIKVLPVAFSQDADRLRRFEQEARAVGMLNHPNILIIHDLGTHDGSPYIVSELLEGETLRERLRAGALLPRKAMDYASQIARGLAAAHEKGVVHRDLKPENLFITRDGRVKILDFGLAKLKQTKFGSVDTDAPTGMPQTDPGVVMGTVGYMSPEQVRGQDVDHRTDLFTFGIILYEMLAGQAAFQGQSAVEIMNAILKEEPSELLQANPQIAPVWERVVRHCLEKSPEQRFQSAHDLAFNLESLSTASGQSASAVAAISEETTRRSFFSWPMLAGAILLATLVGSAAFFMGRNTTENPAPSFRRLTYRRGAIQSARFAPDGQTIVYAAAWDGEPLQIFLGRTESSEAKSLGLPESDLLGISPSGELAILLGHRVFDLTMTTSGTLARVPLIGGAPREVAEGVRLADWGPDGNLAVWRQVGDRGQLEYPIGKKLYETTGGIQSMRVSPKGDRIALGGFYENSKLSLSVVDLNGKKTILAENYGAPGVTWTPDGNEVWFTGTNVVEANVPPFLQAVSLSSGRRRLLMRTTDWLWIHDRARDGRVLMTSNTSKGGIIYLPPGAAKEKDLSWLDWSMLADISADGQTILFTEGREGGGLDATGGRTFIRKIDGSPAVRLGGGLALGFSPDGKQALSLRFNTQQLIILPTGAGETKTLKNEWFSNYLWAGWMPDGKRLLIAGREANHGARLYVQDINGSPPHAITPEGISLSPIGDEGDSGGIKPVSPDGKSAFAIDVEGKLWLYPLEGGQGRLVPGLAPGEKPICWSADGQSIFVYRRGELPARVYLLEVASGQKKLWKEITLSDPAGIYAIDSILLTPDQKACVYTYQRTLSDLYLVEGLK